MFLPTHLSVYLSLSTCVYIYMYIYIYIYICRAFGLQQPSASNALFGDVFTAYRGQAIFLKDACSEIYVFNSSTPSPRSLRGAIGRLTAAPRRSTAASRRLNSASNTFLGDLLNARKTQGGFFTGFYSEIVVFTWQSPSRRHLQGASKRHKTAPTRTKTASRRPSTAFNGLQLLVIVQLLVMRGNSL